MDWSDQMSIARFATAVFVPSTSPQAAIMTSIASPNRSASRWSSTPQGSCVVSIVKQVSDLRDCYTSRASAQDEANALAETCGPHDDSVDVSEHIIIRNFA